MTQTIIVSLLIVILIFIFVINKNKEYFLPTRQTYTLNNINKSIVDCDSINNLKNNNIISRENECRAFNCMWDSSDDLCKDYIYKGCKLNNNKDSCESNNYDDNYSSNRCKWVNNYCIEEDMPTPCKLFNKDECITEDNLPPFNDGSKQQSHCQITNDVCDDKNNNILINNKNKCYYNYINNNICNSTLCSEIELINNSKLCIEKNKLPCSVLNKDICDINSKHCNWDSNTSRCQIIDNNLDTISYEIDINSLSKINTNLNNINNNLNYNRQKYLRIPKMLKGSMIALCNNQCNIDKDEIIVKEEIDFNSFIANKDISSLGVNDILKIKLINNNNNINLIDDNYEYRIIEIISNKIRLNKPIKLNFIQCKNINININTLHTYLKWELISGITMNVFDSIQYSNAIVDAHTINTFYKNY